MPKILIVEDQVRSRDMIKEMVGRFGFETVEADSGSKAIEKFAIENPDLVLLDIFLPDMSGVEVLKKIRKIEPDTRVLVSTASKEEKIKKQCFEAGAEGYLLKPYGVSELKRKLRGIVS